MSTKATDPQTTKQRFVVYADYKGDYSELEEHYDEYLDFVRFSIGELAERPKGMSVPTCEDCDEDISFDERSFSECVLCGVAVCEEGENCGYLSEVFVDVEKKIEYFVCCECGHDQSEKQVIRLLGAKLRQKEESSANKKRKPSEEAEDCPEPKKQKIAENPPCPPNFNDDSPLENLERKARWSEKLRCLECQKQFKDDQYNDPEYLVVDGRRYQISGPSRTSIRHCYGCRKHIIENLDGPGARRAVCHSCFILYCNECCGKQLQAATPRTPPCSLPELKDTFPPHTISYLNGERIPSSEFGATAKYLLSPPPCPVRLTLIDCPIYPPKKDK